MSRLLFLLALLLCAGPIVAKDAPQRLSSSGWHAMEARADSRDRGTAIYLSPHHGHRDMMRVTLFHPATPPQQLPIEWLDLRAGEAALLARTRAWVVDYLARRERDRADNPLLTRPRNFFPLTITELLERCERGESVGSGYNDLAYCINRLLLSAAEIRISAMTDIRSLEMGNDSGRPLQITAISGLALVDMTTGELVEIGRVSRQRTCVAHPKLELCARCTRDFDTLVSGKGSKTAQCAQFDRQSSISARIPYPTFALQAARMDDPRLVILFTQDNGNTFKLRYRLDGLFEVLMAENEIHL